ncbi:MAG TPA: hypothetical protein VME92_07600, partial [Acetobacteraceae bacterium]|nr:hypothetical protein [Acetobacteraceae bacterium]
CLVPAISRQFRHTGDAGRVALVLFVRASTPWQSFDGTTVRKRRFNADARRFPQMHADTNGLNELSGAIIGCAFNRAQSPRSRII